MAKDAARKRIFDWETFLTGHGTGQSRIQLAPNDLVYAQGSDADALFYVESGQVKISVIVPSGKEAVIGLRRDGEFFGTRCLVGRRMGAASALTACTLIRLTTAGLTRLLREEPDFAVAFATYLVRQSIEDQENLVDQLTRSAEKRLARTLLRLADFGAGEDSAPIPAPVNQTELAKMVGTTRSRINHFMNEFKRRGLIEYSRQGYVSVRKALRETLLDA